MKTLLIIIAMIGFWLYTIGSAPVSPVQHTIIVDTWRYTFAQDVANRVGNTQPSQEILDFIIKWTIAEDSSDNAYIRNNPLNTTQSGFNETHRINDDGVKGYATYADGLNATIQTLSYDYYTDIVAGIQLNDAERAKQGLFQSPWASSHYGYGTSWPK
jgi:hypothetical protein